MVMDEQQEQQNQSGNETAAAEEAARQQTRDEEAQREQQLKERDAAAQQQQAGAAQQQQGGAPGDPNDPNKSAAPRSGGVLGRFEHELKRDTGVEAWERHERRRQAFNDVKAGPIGQAINDVNAFIHAMEDCQAETPEAMLADTDVQQAAVRARNGLKVFTGESAVAFSKPTSDAHLNVGSGGAVTGNTPANRERAVAVKAAHGDPVAKAQLEGEDEADEDEEAVLAGVSKVPQPDAHVR
jgi:hypothetical protein